MRFEAEITRMHACCYGHPDYLDAFTDCYRDFISPRISDYFFRLNRWEKDLQIIYNFCLKNELQERDWILFVADYSRKALDEDIGSIQARDSLDTYMKLVRN